MRLTRSGQAEVFVVLCLLASLTLSARETGAAFEGIVVDSRAAGMGDCLSASTSGSLPLSPLPPSDLLGTVSFSYCSPFGLEELAQKSVVCNVRPRRNVLTIGLVERGRDLHKESVFSASASGRLTESVGLSLCLGAYSMSIQGLEASHFLGLSAGARLRPIPRLEACVGLNNLVASRNGGALPQALLLALLLRPASNVTVAGEMRKSPAALPCLHFGVELGPEQMIRLRCGVQTQPVELTLGFCVRLGTVSLESASSFHPVLGRTDVLTLTWLGKEGGS